MIPVVAQVVDYLSWLLISLNNTEIVKVDPDKFASEYVTSEPNISMTSGSDVSNIDGARSCKLFLIHKSSRVVWGQRHFAYYCGTIVVCNRMG